MKRLYTFFLCSLLLGPLWAIDDYEADNIIFSKPPASIAQWYKPQNERQVWLHTMFSLRRSALALSDYAALEDQAGVKKWAQKLVRDYKSIVEMVPEWTDEVDTEWADKLLLSAEKGDYTGIAKAQRELGKTCSSCHKEYRAVTAALYRTPDYENVMVEIEETMEEMSYEKVMQRLGRELNRLMIALEDGHTDKARQAAENLSIGLTDLGSSCTSCHRDDYPKQRILGEEQLARLSELSAAIGNQSHSETQKSVGETAVTICARCHAIHRIPSDLVQKIKK